MIQFNPPRKAINNFDGMWARSGEYVWVHGISTDGNAVLENKHGQTWVAETSDFYFPETLED